MLSGKDPPCQCRRHKFSPGSGRFPWGGKWQPTPAFLPWNSHGQRSPAGYGPWARTESDMTERARARTHTHTHGRPCEDTLCTHPGGRPQEDQPHPHPGLGFRPPGLETGSVCCLSPQALGLCYGNHREWVQGEALRTFLARRTNHISEENRHRDRLSSETTV